MSHDGGNNEEASSSKPRVATFTLGVYTAAESISRDDEDDPIGSRGGPGEAEITCESVRDPNKAQKDPTNSAGCKQASRRASKRTSDGTFL